MNREEKNNLKRQEIIDAAMEEFGKNNYGEASLNAICRNGNISKGIIYHYFKNKDELYLVCVAESFKQLTIFLNDQEFSFGHPKQAIEELLDLRHQFLKEHSDLSNIFTNVLLQPPKHLNDQIKELKTPLNQFNIYFYEQVLDQLELRKGVTRQEAIEYFLIFQESFNYYFQRDASEDLSKLFDEHEFKLSKMLHIMLYGITKEEE